MPSIGPSELPILTPGELLLKSGLDVFDPDRFTVEHAAQRPKCAYFLFLSGPHQYIGNEFALLEMRLIVALVLQQFDVESPTEQTIEPRGSLTLRPGIPVMMRIRLVKD